MLIAATSLDEHAYTPVCKALVARDTNVIVYRTDKVLSNEERLHIEITPDGSLAMSYNDQSIAPPDVGAAWYRKIAAFSNESASKDHARQLHINKEVSVTHDSIWPLYPDEMWLNSPDRIRKSSRKLSQLVLAHELGFTIPRTIIGSDWDDISASLFKENDHIIVKMIRGIISDDETMKALYTTVLDEKELGTLRQVANPFPGLYQPRMPKSREWRITVVGDAIFSASIYTDESAKDDWRKHQLTTAVRFRSEQPPLGTAEKCHQFLGRTGLRFGAFDFIETDDGQMVFLECNPNGQYGWLEESLGFPISESIANQLLKIAEARR